MGTYERYLPHPLQSAALLLKPELSLQVGEAERSVLELGGAVARDLAGVARFMLRSEAIASSRIEGVAPSARQVALAELGEFEDVPGISEQAQLVANNMTIVQEARDRLAEAERVTVEHLVDLHRALLPGDGPHGLRTMQNWVGGSRWHPIDAEFVPPPPSLVPELMADLVAYLNGAAHSPIVQAGLVHAQFETIHPFADGNGRVGRALIHTVLMRRGLARHAVLPVSMVLATRSEAYVAGLTAFRHEASANSTAGFEALSKWLTTFTEAVLIAAEQAKFLGDQLASLRTEWDEQLARARERRGRRRSLRSGSATALILRDLPATPVLSAATAVRLHGVSHVAVGAALEELVDAGILQVSNARRRRYFRSQEVLDLVTWAERRLASTRFDTRISQPVRPAPSAPVPEARE